MDKDVSASMCNLPCVFFVVVVWCFCFGAKVTVMDMVGNLVRSYCWCTLDGHSQSVTFSNGSH